jgi:CheY-like chemotaxis protein
VEDNPIDRAWMVQTLRQSGRTVVQASDGKQALAYLKTWPAPALVVLDMVLPGVDGWEVLNRLQMHETTRTIPIIICTGTMLAPTWAADHGCAGVLRKPIDEETLLREVTRCSQAHAS